MSEEHVTSSVTVSPGEIKDFAKFLNEISSALDTMKGEALALVSAPDLGEYDASQTSYQRYTAATTKHKDFLTTLADRCDRIVTGTNRLADRYADLETLNSAGGNVVQTTLEEGV